MGYYQNIDTSKDILFHGSKEGIVGEISPDKSMASTDFGNGFYLGTKELQTLSRVTNEPAPYAYEFKIPDTYINENNTITLSVDDWVYFVLYNRGRLEDMKGTDFYDKYEHLADGKDFIIGPIADDVYGKCIDDFCDGRITDWTFRQLIDCFDYGIQIVAKSQRACDCLEPVSERAMSKDERKSIIDRRKMSKKERFQYYNDKVAELNKERRGEYLSEIKEKIIALEAEKLVGKATERNEHSLDIIEDSTTKLHEFQNIKFPDKIHERKDVEHGIFR